MTPPVAVVVLAAGASRRLGRPKQLLTFRGQTLLARAVGVARAADCGPVFAVLPPAAGAMRREIDSAARVVENPDREAGLGTSIRAGVAAAESSPGVSAILFTVCDQPLVTAELLRELVAAHRRGRGLVASGYGGAVGVPALFARQFFGELRALPAGAGAKRLLARHAAGVFAVAFPSGDFDVDTPADAERLDAAGGA